MQFSETAIVDDSSKRVGYEKAEGEVHDEGAVLILNYLKGECTYF